MFGTYIRSLKSSSPSGLSCQRLVWLSSCADVTWSDPRADRISEWSLSMSIVMAAQIIRKCMEVARSEVMSFSVVKTGRRL